MIKFKIMEITKEKELIFELDSQLFIVNPQVKRTSERTTFILTEFNKDYNFDRILASPGEYNIGSVFIYSFSDDKKRLFYYFESDEGRLFLGDRIDEEISKKLKEFTESLEGLIFIGENLKNEIIRKLEIKNIFSLKEINLSGFEKNIGKKFKLNLKRSMNKLYILK